MLGSRAGMWGGPSNEGSGEGNSTVHESLREKGERNPVCIRKNIASTSER